MAPLACRSALPGRQPQGVQVVIHALVGQLGGNGDGSDHAVARHTPEPGAPPPPPSSTHALLFKPPPPPPPPAPRRPPAAVVVDPRRHYQTSTQAMTVARRWS